MPPRKNKTKGQREQIVLQLYNCGSDELEALLIDEILVAYNSIIRVKLPGEPDPLFLRTRDCRIEYHRVLYSDFSVSTIDEAREWLARNGKPITAFDPRETLEGRQRARELRARSEDTQEINWDTS